MPPGNDPPAAINPPSNQSPSNQLSIKIRSDFCRHIEIELLAVGRGEFDRSHLLLAAVLDRPLIKCLMQGGTTEAMKAQTALHAMLAKARQSLADLYSAGRKDRKQHLAFESFLGGIIPDDADESRQIALFAELLQVNRKSIERVLKRGRDSNFSQYINVVWQPNARRSDYVAFGRQVASEFWHAMCRLDTRPAKAIKIRLGVNEYQEHWRHVQYLTDQEMAALFFASPEYKKCIEITKKNLQGRPVLLMQVQVHKEE